MKLPLSTFLVYYLSFLARLVKCARQEDLSIISPSNVWYEKVALRVWCSLSSLHYC